MRPTSRLVLAAAALSLGAAWLLPLWRIGLQAPQYPEGLGLVIWLDTITGQKPADLASINNLNHYIGMKAIVPDAIPELRLMPRLLGGLMLLGLLAAAAGRRSGLYAWTAAFGLLAAAGLVDFYIWGYDYGHDLDPTAAIKVPGLSYQPPILGSKQLLNFTAHSWPAAGGGILAAAFAVGLALCWFEWRWRGRRSPAWGRLDSRRRAIALSLVVAGAALTMACAAPGPGVIHYDVDACDHCRMTIAEPAFAAQLVTRTGRVLRFDDPGCLVAFLAGDTVPPADVHGAWFDDHAHPARLVAAADAVFLRSAQLRAPMHGGLAAFASRADAEAAQRTLGGTLTTWDAVRTGGAS